MKGSLLLCYSAAVKWVEDTPGLYRLVDDEDPRPAVELPSRRGAPTIRYNPSWRKYEAGQFIGNADEQIEAGDKFLQEREHEMKVDPKARKWEESRKKSLLKDKPAWRKERMKSDPFFK